MNRTRSPLTRGILALAIALLVGEIIARLVGAPVLPPDPAFIEAHEWSYPDWVEKDSELFWKYRPSRVIDGSFIKPGRYTINSYGYRGPEFADTKPDGTVRVVCLGESNTFGLGVSDEAAWPRQLERQLNVLDPQKRRWEVLNLAVTNYSTFQGVRQARRELPRLKPDIVLSCFSWADHQPAANGISDDRIEMGSSWQLEVEDALNRSALIRWVKVGWSRIVRATPPKEATPGFDQRRVATTEYSENVEKITREALAAGARPVTVTSPIAWPPKGFDDASGIFHIHHRYRRLTRFGSIAAFGEFVELANAIDENPRFYDDPETEIALFNAQGHAFAGQFLARYLLGDSALIEKYGSRVYTEGR